MNSECNPGQQDKSIQGGPQKNGTILHALTLPNINRFSKLFNCQNEEKIGNKKLIILSLKIPPHLRCVTTLPCEMSGVLKATIIENKTTSVTAHFKKLKKEKTCLLAQLLSKVTVTLCSFYIKMFNVSALLLYDALKPATPLTNGAINETL